MNMALFMHMYIFLYSDIRSKRRGMKQKLSLGNQILENKQVFLIHKTGKSYFKN